ncbi:hypothetical protein G4B88_027299 [Cannabis sativa]|uniref:U5 small nuclear ribonucleoprotein TSSC4 n=1 Tax=Cannabis sativa TaxID=3483 RepID=A0A7J6HS32_CANSA|nr:hypothetical protein G4B88_027299 [Cannabis sativa]
MEEEDSFKLRVNKIFGSLNTSSSSASSTAFAATTPSSTLNSLWCLTDEEIVRREWNRDKDTPEHPEPVSNSIPNHDHTTELENDLEDLDDEEEEVEDKSLSIINSTKPDDYNDEEWEVKSGIGLDCTLDYEEEEDEYDKVAVGGDEKPEEIDDYGIDIDSGNVLPTSIKQVPKDPRANHLAAKLRIKEDAEAAKNINQVDTESNVSNPKSILKRKDNQVDSKSHKRVRFDPECKDNGNGNGGDTDTVQGEDFGFGVPDFLRNPSKYTHYTFDDSSSNLNDEESNKQAYMDFFNLMKKKSSSGSDDLDEKAAFESFGSVTFIPRKKSGDTNAMVDSCTELVQQVGIGKDVSSLAAVRPIAAVEFEESDVCAMEEDEPDESMEDRKKSNNSPKPGRQYRVKARSDSDD